MAASDKDWEDYEPPIRRSRREEPKTSMFEYIRRKVGMSEADTRRWLANRRVEQENTPNAADLQDAAEQVLVRKHAEKWLNAPADYDIIDVFAKIKEAQRKGEKHAERRWWFILGRRLAKLPGSEKKVRRYQMKYRGK
jgi:hypothetical protein